MDFHRNTALHGLVLATLLIGTSFAQAFDLQGHRGARGHLPENTLAAFTRALEIGVATLETDAVITKDGVVALGHDPRLNPDLVRNAKGEWLDAKGPAITTLSYAELQTYDVGRIKPGTRYAQTFASQQPLDGTRMPTLASLFELVKTKKAEHIRFDIETKLSPLDPEATLAPAEFVTALLAVINQHGMGKRVQIQSFDWRTLRIIEKTQPEIETVCLSSSSAEGRGNIHDPRWTDGFKLDEHGGSAPRLVKAAGCDVWSPNFNNLKADSLSEAKKLGLKVVPWTVNEPSDIEAMLAMQPDGMISDYPDRVREAMARRGMPLPPIVK